MNKILLMCKLDPWSMLLAFTALDHLNRGSRDLIAVFRTTGSAPPDASIACTNFPIESREQYP
jgi:hypothetical protein